MGWLFRYDVNFTIADQVAELRRPERYAPNYKLLRSVRIGNNHWYLMEQIATGHLIIGLDLMKGPSKKHGEGAGYKGIDETWGPCEVNCPLSILDNARAPENHHAYEWRQRVRRFHAAKAAKSAAIKAGAIVEYGGFKYRLGSSAGPRKGWYCTRLDRPDLSFRMRAQQVSAAKPVTEAA